MNELPEEITVRVLKHDGTEYRRWRAKIAKQDAQMIVLDAEFDTDVSHDFLGEIHRGTRTVEYYWEDRWYNVFRFLNLDGSTRLYYCNINTPPKIASGVLSYIDLEMDILVHPDFSYQILDLEEFEVNAAAYGYSNHEKAKAQQALEEMVLMIQTRQFPFTETEQSASTSSVVNRS